jgi:hypothetical protein
MVDGFGSTSTTMASRFTALPLSVGEAFVLETTHLGDPFVVLFDGGQTKQLGHDRNEPFQLLRSRCPAVKTHIDVAICSHSDNDHAGGFPALIETWTSAGNTIGECWLPARWSAVARLALTDPEALRARLLRGSQAVAKLLRQEAPEAASQPSPANTEADPAGASFVSTAQRLSELGRRQLALESRPSAAAPARASWRQKTAIAHATLREDFMTRDQTVARSLGLSHADLMAIRVNLDADDELAVPLSERSGPNRDGSTLSDEAQTWAATQHARAIEAADAIQRIAQTAVKHAIPIRWFDFAPLEAGQAPRGGITNLLQPLNTVEVGPDMGLASDQALFLALRLTEQNVASLVFQRVQASDEPSVIFVADSRLAFGVDKPERDFPKHLEPVTRPIVYTAAHHGSRNNDRAYEVLKGWLGEPIFKQSIAVRNGGVSNQVLEQFLKIDLRRCAQCTQCHGHAWSQLVTVTSVGGEWQWPPEGTQACARPQR